MVVVGRLLTGRASLRLPALIHQIELVSFRGVPIIFLISLIVGAILADTEITERQKQVLLDIYDSFRRENEQQQAEAGQAAATATARDQAPTE